MPTPVHTATFTDPSTVCRTHIVDLLLSVNMPARRRGYWEMTLGTWMAIVDDVELKSNWTFSHPLGRHLFDLPVRIVDTAHRPRIVIETDC